MIYLFDKTQTLTGVIDEHTQALNATLEMKINEASTLDFSLPLDDELAEKMANVKYVGVPSPNSADKIVFLRLMTIKDEADRVEYMAKELAYQELSSSGYIEDKRPAESDAQTLMNIALDGSGYKLGVVNVPGKVKTNFYYTDRLSAIANVVKLLGGEIYFYVSLTGSKITGRYMDYVAEQGTNTSKTFADGSNLITVERKRDMSSVYTAILPRGKGEQVSSGEGDTPDGYGRRIDISGVTWSKANGNPLDKKVGDKIIIDPDATAEYGNADGTPRLLLKTYDDIEDANILINKAYMDLMAINKPAVQYSATVANVGDMQLGDTIVIMHSKRSMSYRTRVFHITYDLIDNTKTVAEFGNDLSKDSITSQINSISSNGATISDQVQWNISNGGHNNTSYGAKEPANPRIGDVWFKALPNGNTEEYYFDGTIWVLGAKTDQQWQENRAIAQGTHTTFYGTATPVGAVAGDVWFKNDNNEPDAQAMYTYSGSVWVKFRGAYDANRLTVGEINGKILQITNVNTANLVGDIDGKLNKIKNIDTSALVGGLDGTKNPLSNVPADQLVGTMNKEVVNTINLNAEQITSGKLNSNIVNAIELNAAQITSGQLNSNIVNAIELNARQITSGELNSNIVNAIKLNASQITTGELNANIVAAMRLNASQIVAGQIDASLINVFNLNADNIKTGTIDASKINVMNVSASNITTGSLSANFLKGGQIDASQINVININAQNIIGTNASFVKASWDNAYGNSVTIDPDAVNFKFQAGDANQQIYNRVDQAGFSITSNIGLSSGIIGEVSNFGGKTSGFTTDNYVYGLNHQGITIGDGKNYKAENMAWGISMKQGSGAAPQLIWAGANVGKVKSDYKVWDNPQGWIMPENIRFSTWDNTASIVWFDNTVNVNMQAAEFRITHFNDSGVFAHKWQGSINNLPAIGMTTGGKEAGWAVTGDDTWIFVHGQAYSVYQILSKVGMI